MREARLALFGQGETKWTKLEDPSQRRMIAMVLMHSELVAIQALARLMLTTSFTGTAMVTLMEKVGVKYQKVVQEYHEIKKHEGMLRVADHLPDLMEQAAIAARDSTENCVTCRGTGMYRRGRCKDCRGTGKEKLSGSLERLKLIFETSDLIGKRSGVNVNLDLRKVPEPDSMESVVSSLPIIDGSVR